MMDSVNKIYSYVLHEKGNGEKVWFFVSTAERDSSAMVSPPPRFNETIAWEYDHSTMVRGNIVAQDGSGECYKQHIDMCKALAKHGTYDSVETYDT